jgi:zinc finger protein
MCIASIPYFSEIIVMAFSCIECGHRSSEIKHGGGMSDKATKIVFTALGERDLHRDVFKSDSCELSIPEVGLEMSPGTQGSMYTTMEGLFDQTITHLKKANPFGSGDSKESKDFLAFIDKLTDYKDGKVFPFTIILDDPLSNCFIYNANAPEDCPQTKITVYERTHEQNEELGINQMNV